MVIGIFSSFPTVHSCLYTESREFSKTVSTRINRNFVSDFNGFRTCLYCPFLSLSTNYSIEAKSSVLLSIAQFPGTFFCQTGFFNILNLHLGVFSFTFYTDSVSPLKNHIQLWVYVFPLSHNSWPQRQQAFITNCREECTTLSSTWHSCSSSTSALQSLIQHPDSSLHIV